MRLSAPRIERPNGRVRAGSQGVDEGFHSGRGAHPVPVRGGIGGSGNELQRALSLVDEGLECVARMTRRVWLPPVNLTPPQVAIGLLGVGAEAHRRLGDHQRQVDLLLRRLEWSRVVAEAEAELETLRLLVDAQTDAGHVDDARRSVIEDLLSPTRLVRCLNASACSGAPRGWMIGKVCSTPPLTGCGTRLALRPSWAP